MLGPGIPNPMLFAGGDPLDEYGKIERSVRLNSPDSPAISRGFSAGSSVLFTWSGWCKRTRTTAAGTPVLFGGMSSSVNYFEVTFNGSDQIYVVNRPTGGVNAQITTNRVFRDLAAHAHVHFVWDSNNAAASDRMRLYVNGERITSFASSSFPTLGLACVANSVMAHYLGADGVGNYLDAYLSAVGFVDGQALGPEAFGAFHPKTGQWRPKSNAAIRAAVAAGGGTRNGWGANGFLLPFSDTTSLTTLCYDRSQSDGDTTGNNFTATNISLTAGAGYDSSLDTPTNNFCALNPLVWRNGAVQPTYSNGNLDVLNTSGVAEAYSLGTMPLPAGETYFEVTVLAVSAATPIIGVADVKTMTSVFTNTFGYMVTGQKQINGVNTAYGAAFTTGDVIGVRVNTTVPEIEFYKQTAGAGAFVSQGVIALNAGVEYFPYVNTVLNSKAAFNFGQRAFNNASPPANAKMLCTKVMPVKPGGPMKSASAFVAVKDSGANILSTLATARASWSAWIDIIKRSDSTAEGWRWIFSDDPANYIDSSSTAAKAAVPAFSGSAYAGWSLKVSASNGVATGTIVHTNGAASVVSDGLSNARKMIILLRESAGGGSRYVYHPELTAGKLMYLEQKTAETTDASINTVTASGFTAASTLPSGTYRWISIAETPDFIKLWRNIGNGTSTDGRFVTSGFPPALDLCKRADVAAPWSVHDIARSSNVNVLELQLNATQGENAATDPDPAALDLVSNGTKVRTNMGDTNAAYSNANGGAYIGLSIAAFPFRYANAR